MWYKWESIELFNQWKSDIEYRLQIPFPGTDNYALPVVISLTDVRAFVPLKGKTISDFIGIESENPFPPTLMNDGVTTQ